MSSFRALCVAILGLESAGCNDDAAPVVAQDVSVYESRGRQCEAPLTAQQSGLKLIQQGLDVRRSGCGSIRNVAFPSVCGAPTALILVHVIPAVSLEVAERAGFSSVDSLKDGYTSIDCGTGAPLP